MEDMIPCAVKDQEVFQRVWQRVMEGRDQGASPVQPGIPGGWEGDLSCECLKALMRQGGSGLPPECERQEHQRPVVETEAAGEVVTAPPTQPEAPVQRPAPAPEPPMEPEPSIQDDQSGWQSAGEAPAPEPPAEDQPVPEEPCGDCSETEGLPPENGPDRGSDLPRLWEEPQPADDRTARLRRHVMDALEGWQFYRHLAKRARGTDARTLNGMAGDQHKEARKLAAAYFLLTGLRYWPTELLGTPAIPSYWGALRTRHQAEQRQENAYRLASDDWEDPDLVELYAALIEGCQRRCQQLRSLLEQDIT